jgi:hypothetical protein
MAGDRLIRASTAAVLVAVAAFAAVVSYSHIYDLGRAHGQDVTAARLLPLSVDGLILAASLVLLHEARNGRAAPALARFALWLGVGGTIAASGAYGVAVRAGRGGAVDLGRRRVRDRRRTGHAPGAPVPLTRTRPRTCRAERARPGSRDLR